jgi:hypothetical protein
MDPNLTIVSATTSDEEEGASPSKRSRNAPLSIEEQFQKQFTQSLEAHLFHKVGFEYSSPTIPIYSTTIPNVTPSPFLESQGE